MQWDRNSTLFLAKIEVKRAEEMQVSIQTQTRALMSRYHQMIKKREQSMLTRLVAEIDFDVDSTKYRNHIQGKTIPWLCTTYARSHAAMS